MDDQRKVPTRSEREAGEREGKRWTYRQRSRKGVEAWDLGTYIVVADSIEEAGEELRRQVTVQTWCKLKDGVE